MQSSLPFFTARIKSLLELAADHIGEGLGGFVVEATAALSILVYLAFLSLASRWNQQSSAQGIFYSALTGVCAGVGTIAFFLLFQKGGPLSAVPVILAVGAAIMAIAGILFFREPASWPRLTGIVTRDNRSSAFAALIIRTGSRWLPVAHLPSAAN